VDFRAGAKVYRRGGESDRRLSPAWLVAATIGLGHTAGDDVGVTVPCHALDHRGGLGRRDRLPGSG
jgi:hypothetical protein